MTRNAAGEKPHLEFFYLPLCFHAWSWWIALNNSVTHFSKVYCFHSANLNHVRVLARWLTIAKKIFNSLFKLNVYYLFCEPLLELLVKIFFLFSLFFCLPSPFSIPSIFLFLFLGLSYVCLHMRMHTHAPTYTHTHIHWIISKCLTYTLLKQAAWTTHTIANGLNKSDA